MVEIVNRHLAGVTVLVAILGVWPATAAARVSDTPAASWQANGRVSAMAISNGKIYIGGSFTDVMPAGSPTTLVARHHLAAFSARTGALLPWNPGANGAVLALRAVAGTVYAGGAFTAVGGHTRDHLAAIAARRGRVLPWRLTADGDVTAMTAIGGNLYLGGDFLHVGGQARKRLAAVSLASGALVAGWHPTANRIVHALVGDGATGVVYAGGDFSNVSGHIRPYLVALSAATGGLRPFSSTPAGRVWSLALSSSRVFAAEGGTGGQLDAYAKAGGGLDWQRLADGDVQAVAYSNGQLFAGGHFANVCATAAGGGNPWVCNVPVARARLFAANPVTGAVEAWNPGADSLWGVWVVRATSSVVAAGGDFVHIGGIHQQSVARFLRS
jgi:Domain of unknown function (DUF5122) beta-propeller